MSGTFVPGEAPPLHVTQWFNSEQDITLDGLLGKVVVVHAFQMLCPGCVMNSMPQAVRAWLHYGQNSPGTEVFTIGLHTVFEHHRVMTPAALEVYLHEFRIPFPVGVDAAGTNDPIPQTMRSYGMRGTPTTLLIDKQGRLRSHRFGVESDESLIAEIDFLLAEK